MSIRTGLIAAASLVCLSGYAVSPALADDAELRLPSFDSLQRAATESVDVTLGSWPLGLASWALSQSDDPKDRDLRDTLQQLKSIKIRSFKFAKDYDHSVIDRVRSQFSEPGWKAVTQVRSRGDEDNVDIYVHTSHEALNGFALIASNPHELTIVNIVGTVDPAKIARLSNHFGVPELPM